MIWESFCLNKIYKTLDFKLTLPKYSTTINKEPLKESIKEDIDYYNLSFSENIDNSLSIHLNQITCALYHHYSHSNTTYYFDFYSNAFFFLYCRIYSNGENHLFNQFQQDFKVDDSIIYQWQRYFLQLNFLNEINQELFIKEMKEHIEYHLKYNNFILKQFSYFDVILLSIISRNANLFAELNQENNNYSSITRWYIYTRGYLGLDFNIIRKVYEQKEKENLIETYKMNSNQIIVNALLNKDYQLLNAMLEKNENVNSRNLKEYKTLCHWACAKGDRKALDILLKFNCNLEALDLELMTPIFDAIYSGDISLCEYLLNEKGVDLNHKEIQNRTPFYWAACTGRIEMIKYLMTKPNIDINATSKMGRSSLSKSCWNGRIDIVELLCQQKNIVINYPDNNGRYPIHNAVWGEYGGRQGKKMSELTTTDSPLAALCLINHGADIEVRDNEGDTPFMIASSTNGIESMKVLIEHGANPNSKNSKGRTSLIQSTQYGNWESVQCLLSFIRRGYSIDLDIRDNNSYRAIDNAVLYKRIICFKILFDFDTKYQTMTQMVELSRLALQSNSYLCFEFILGNLCKIDNVDKRIYEELIMRALALENIKCFNYINKEIPKIVEEILCDDGNNGEMIGLIYASYLINHEPNFIVEEKNINRPEHNPINYDEIKNKKMTEVDEDFFEPMIDDNNNNTLNSISNQCTPEIMQNYIAIVNTLFQNYITNIIHNNKGINESFLKILIKNDQFDLLKDNPSLTFNNLYHTPNNNTLPKTVLNKDYHNQFHVMKHGITSSNNYDLIWKDIIEYYNTNTVISILINSNKSDFFNYLIQYPFIRAMIFSITPFTKKNIFHILFSNVENHSKFQKIIEIIEQDSKERIGEIVTMLNEKDSFSSTPLDILMKADNYVMLEHYTSILHNLLQKHSINLIEGIQLYTIKTYDIQLNTIKTDEKYKDFIYEKIKQLRPRKIDDINEVYHISKYSITPHLKKTIGECLEKIIQGNIENDFLMSNPAYGHKFIQNNAELIEACQHLSKETIIGVDAEFNGNSCEVDGIVCLIQISSFTMSYAIDTLALRKEIGLYLKPIFENEGIIKVLHGCDNDICWLLGNFDIYLKNIFDTGRAFLVYQNIILNKTFKLDNLPSLYFLVKFFMGIKLDKSYQKSDWRIRPLTNNMLQYGFNDAKSVLYLYYIFQGLFLYLMKDNFIITNNTYVNYYKNMKPKFAKDREDISKVPTDIPLEDIKPLLIRIAYKCYELIKLKLKDSYTHLDITLND